MYTVADGDAREAFFSGVVAAVGIGIEDDPPADDLAGVGATPWRRAGQQDEEEGQ